MEKEFKDIKSLLGNEGVDFRVYVHEPVYTSDQAARVRKEPQKSGVKSLIFFCDRNPVLILVRGDHSADTRKIKRVTGAKDVRLATPEEVMNACNCEIGSVHPLGQLMQVVRTIMDKTISENARVNFSAGLHTHTISMNLTDFVRIAQPEIVDIAKV